MSDEVHIAESAEQIASCFDAISVLRPHVHRDGFANRVLSMAPQGFRLAYIERDGVVQAVVGFRIIDMLRTGRMLEIDDLVALPVARSNGFGKRLVDWCVEVAKQNDCTVVELDSAVHRADAHRFYFRERMHVLAFHFSKDVA
jgi:GNAT superfamily N-acetyltransferase